MPVGRAPPVVAADPVGGVKRDVCPQSGNGSFQLAVNVHIVGICCLIPYPGKMVPSVVSQIGRSAAVNLASVPPQAHLTRCVKLPVAVRAIVIVAQHNPHPFCGAEVLSAGQGNSDPCSDGIRRRTQRRKYRFQLDLIVVAVKLHRAADLSSHPLRGTFDGPVVALAAMVISNRSRSFLKGPIADKICFRCPCQNQPQHRNKRNEINQLLIHDNPPSKKG